MPLYEYQCDACGKRFEIIQKFSDSPAESCRHCGGGPVQRLISSPAIQFKGTGWYITDYSQKGKPPAAGADTPKESGDTSKGAESKTASSSESSSVSSESASRSGGSSDTSSAAAPATPPTRTP